jgi:hypothetical protein
VLGGEGAKTARENFEKTTGVKVVSPQNYLDQPKNKERDRNKFTFLADSFPA